MKRNIKQILITLFILIPLSISGIIFSYENFEKTVNINEMSTSELSGDYSRASDNSYYLDPKNVDYIVYEPTSPSFDESENFNFQFQVEKRSGTWDDFYGSLSSFDVVFEQYNSYYVEDEIGRLKFSRTAEGDKLLFKDYFNIVDGANDGSSVATFAFIEPVWLAGEFNEFNWIPNEQYQVRIAWKGEDASYEEQYTEPTAFAYASELPGISISSYFGYSQAVVKVRTSISEDAMDMFYGGLTSDIYDSFKITWGDNISIDIPSVLEAVGASSVDQTKDFILKADGTKDYIDMYLLFDNLREGDTITVNIDYQVNADNYNVGYRNKIDYSTTFHSDTYQAPSLLSIDESKIQLLDLDELNVDDYNRYGDFIIPVQMQWVDTKMPLEWAYLSNKYRFTIFQSEIEYNNVIDELNLRTIKSSAGETIDPTSVVVDDVSYLIDGEDGLNWTENTDGDLIKTTYLYFNDLELGETYTFDFEYVYEDPEMFNGSPIKQTETVSVTIPEALDAPTAEITNISVPLNADGTVNNDPSNWNELEVTFNLMRAPTWGASYAGSITAENTFDKIEIIAVEELEDEDGNVYWDFDNAISNTYDNKPLFAENTYVFEGLNSEKEYGFQIKATINDTYAKIFGFDTSIEPGVITSDIVSSTTRMRFDQFEITSNSDAHDVYEPGDEEIEYTYAFYIDSPLSGQWDIINNDELALDPTLATSSFYYKNIIEDVYITDVYSEKDTESAAAQTLYDERFYVDNTNKGEQNLVGTNIDELFVDNSTNDVTNWNTITVSDLVTSWYYEGKLVVELTPEACDTEFGWMITHGSNTITKDVVLQPGRPIKAPILGLDPLTPYTTTQTQYNEHEVILNFIIDLSPIENPDTTTYPTKDDYFQYILNRPGTSVDIVSEIQLQSGDGPVGSSVKLNWADFIATDKYDPATETYSYEYKFSNLDGFTQYRVDIVNTEDLGYIEDVLDFSSVFETNQNEAILDSDIAVSVTDFETGAQNEGSNKFEEIKINVTQLDKIDAPSYYGQLSGNINSMEVVNSSGVVVATFNPEEISWLTNGDNTVAGDETSITATLINPVDPKTVINLAEYSLVVENDNYTAPGFTATLDTLVPAGADTTITVGGLENPAIQSVNMSAYRDHILVDWSVSHMNNIKEAQLLVGEYDPILGTTSPVASQTYDSATFNVPDDSNWEGTFRLDSFKAGYQYFAVLNISKTDECVDDDTGYINIMASNVVEGPENLNIYFDIVDVRTSTDAIVLDYSWTNNTSVIIDRIFFQVVDTYSDELDIDGNPPVIFEDMVDINNVVNGSGSITIDNSTVIPGYELYSNQEYEIRIGYTKALETGTPDEEIYNITTILEDSTDSDLLKPVTDEKGNIFVDSISLEESSSEDFTIKYQWRDRDGSYINKGVVDHRIRLYKGDIVNEDRLLLESDNLVDIAPGNEGEISFTISNGMADLTGKPILISPTLKFTIETYVVYDTYAYNSREAEEESISTLEVLIPWNKTNYNILNAEYLDNDSIEITILMEDITAFELDPDSYLDIYFKNSDGEFVDVIYNGEVFDASEGIVFKIDDIKEIPGMEQDLVSDTMLFSIRLDGVVTEFQDYIEIFSSVHVNNIDGTITDITQTTKITNNSDQSKYPFINGENFGVLNRAEVGGNYYYEIQVQSNHAINSFTDVVISDEGTPNTSSTDIEVLNEAQVLSVDEWTYNEYNLYLSVDKGLVTPETEFNDLSFLVGRYIGINAKNLTIGAKEVRLNWGDYDWFEIEGFKWIYPPKTVGEILLAILIWLLIIIAILLVIGIIIGTAYYIFRITFSNKKWYPIVEAIANEKFEVFTNYVNDYGWTPKYQEYADLSEKNIHELREYALKMNIPITFEMNRKELLRTVSLLSDEEIEIFETFSDDDIDVRNFEILDFWKVARYKSYHPWIKYKMSKLEERGILNDDDNKLASLQEQLDYIEKQKEVQAEREKAFEEIQELVSDVLDVNTELTTEFTVDPLESFKKELEEKVAREEEIAEAERKAEEEAEAARIAEEEAKAAAEAAALAAKNEKEIKSIKARLKLDYEKITLAITAFNDGAHKEVQGADKAQEVADKLNRERIKIKKLIETFKARQNRISELGGRQKAYPFEPLEKVDIKIAMSKFEKASKELEGLTKQQLLAKASEMELEVKPAWSKDRLVKDIVKQMKDRGDLDD